MMVNQPPDYPAYGASEPHHHLQQHAVQQQRPKAVAEMFSGLPEEMQHRALQLLMQSCSVSTNGGGGATNSGAMLHLQGGHASGGSTALDANAFSGHSLDAHALEASQQHCSVDALLQASLPQLTSLPEANQGAHQGGHQSANHSGNHSGNQSGNQIGSHASNANHSANQISSSHASNANHSANQIGSHPTNAALQGVLGGAAQSSNGLQGSSAVGQNVSTGQTLTPLSHSSSAAHASRAAHFLQDAQQGKVQQGQQGHSSEPQASITSLWATMRGEGAAAGGLHARSAAAYTSLDPHSLALDGDLEYNRRAEVWRPKQ